MPPQRRRQRNKKRSLSDYGIDLPDIDGVPMALIPVYWHAWTKARDGPPKSLLGDLEKGKQGVNPNGNHPVDEILRRMEPFEASASSSNPDYRPAIDAWTTAMTRLARDQRDMAVVAFVDDLWAKRRHEHVHAALYMLYVLLSKSAAARRHWLGQSDLLDFMDKQATNEALQDLRRILYDGGVLEKHAPMEALRRRLDQVLPAAYNSATVHNREALWRACRDLALQHGDQQEERIQRLLRKSRACIQVLVPRLTTDDNVGEDHDDEDDSVAWEEGDSDSLGEDHEVAVARTMQAMQTTGALHHGQLQIRLAAAPPDTSSSTETLEARERLIKYVSLLSSRYLPRLDVWVQALTQADHLTTGASTGALMRMTPSQIQRRQVILNKLMTLKSEVASLLSSVRRLGVNATEPPKRATAVAPRPRVQILYRQRT